MKKLFRYLALLSLAACTTQPEKLQWQAVDYSHVTGWETDRHAEALQAFSDSCRKPKKTDHAIKPIIDEAAWREACTVALSMQTPTQNQARAFFESYFVPYRLTTDQRQEGLLTGYYIPIFNGSLAPDNRYYWPVYKRPADLGKDPYLTRAEIDNGALRNRGLEIAWVGDPVMLFFLHIQGSGRLRLSDGRMVELRYDGKNNRAYVAIGKLLIERGELTKENVSMQTIRQWLYDHPGEAMQLMQENPSYIFFKLSDAESMAPGAQGVALTPERSLAIDPKFLPYGIPVFLNTTNINPAYQVKPFHQLLITQDTGGAIKGYLRGDVFFGQGEEAEELAGMQKQSGSWTVLVPRRVMGHVQAAAQE